MRQHKPTDGSTEWTSSWRSIMVAEYWRGRHLNGPPPAPRCQHHTRAGTRPDPHWGAGGGKWDCTADPASMSGFRSIWGEGGSSPSLSARGAVGAGLASCSSRHCETAALHCKGARTCPAPAVRPRVPVPPWLELRFNLTGLLTQAPAAVELQGPPVRHLAMPRRRKHTRAHARVQVHPNTCVHAQFRSGALPRSSRGVVKREFGHGIYTTKRQSEAHCNRASAKMGTNTGKAPY